MKKLAKRKKRTEYTNKYALHTEHKFHFKIGEVKETVMEWMKERKKKVGTHTVRVHWIWRTATGLIKSNKWNIDGRKNTNKITNKKRLRWQYKYSHISNCNWLRWTRHRRIWERLGGGRTLAYRQKSTRLIAHLITHSLTQPTYL